MFPRRVCRERAELRLGVPCLCLGEPGNGVGKRCKWLGDTAARDRALRRARALRQSMTSRQEIYVVDIATARLDDASHSGPSSPERLLTLAADAERRHWVAWALEAKLAAWQLLRARQADRAQALYRDIDETARRHGFGRIRMLLKHPVGGASSAMPRARAQSSTNARSLRSGGLAARLSAGLTVIFRAHLSPAGG